MDMKKFFKNLISSSDESSSKRFVAIIIILCSVLMTFLAAFRAVGWVPPAFMFEGLLWIAAGALGLTAAENIFSKKKPLPPPSEEPEQEIELKN
jgi:CHASE2 domain-containing sensor protein